MSNSLELAPFVLNDGHELPAVGLGTFDMKREAGITSIMNGLANGYRLVDTAVGYDTEAEVGEAIRRSDVAASEVVVTTKIRASGHGYDAARRSVEESRRILGIDQIGLYLIHWPNPRLDKYVDTWRALVGARSDGEIRSIGVSNFTPEFLGRIIDATGVTPAINQIELHPHFPQARQRSTHSDLGICTQSWSPLGLGRHALLGDPTIAAIASEHAASPAQVILRWHHQLGCLPIPRSTNTQRQADNLALGFVLTEQDMNRIDALGRPDQPHHGRLWGGNPETQQR